jgi:hypothetical protein
MKWFYLFCDFDFYVIHIKHWSRDSDSSHSKTPNRADGEQINIETETPSSILPHMSELDDKIFMAKSHRTISFRIAARSTLSRNFHVIKVWLTSNVVFSLKNIHKFSLLTIN